MGSSQLARVPVRMVLSCTLTLGALAGGVSGTASFAVIIDTPIAVGSAQISNAATISANGSASAIGSVATALTSAPALGATKTVVDLNGGQTLPGDVVRYRIIIQNTGNTAATGATFANAIPADTTYVASSTMLNGAPIADVAGAMPYASGGPINTPGALSGQINVGGTATVIFSVVINKPLPTGVTQVSNQGMVSANAVAGILTDDPRTPAGGDPTMLTISKPTAITLASFTATAQDDAITVRWVTSAEFRTWGFYLYRSADGTRAHAVRVTPALILGQGRSQGAAYAWIDRDTVPGTTYRYWLQEVELSGATSEYGPASATRGPAGSGYRIFIAFVGH